MNAPQLQLESALTSLGRSALNTLGFFKIAPLPSSGLSLGE